MTVLDFVQSIHYNLASHSNLFYNSAHKYLPRHNMQARTHSIILHRDNKSQENVVIVLPTYNESETIIRVLQLILKQQSYLARQKLSILVIDDSSTDGTTQLVREFSKKNNQVYLLTGKKYGLGAAYKRGFHYAIKQLNADIVFEIDADLSHDPSLIPFFIRELESGYDFVIGSRYISGGSVPNNWSLFRKANSKLGNIFARYVTGMKTVTDCTSGYRAIRTSLLKKIKIKTLATKGYAFQIALLHKALQNKAQIKEFPIQFQDREFGKSKLQIRDIVEFILSAFTLRFPYLQYVFLSIATFLVAVSGFTFGLLVTYLLTLIQGNPVDNQALTTVSILSFAFLLSLQGMFNIFLLIFAWEDIERVEKDKSPTTFVAPKYAFTALVPVRNEQFVIADTIRAIDRIDYPESLKETLIICRTDDYETIRKAEQAIYQLNKKNIRLVLFNDLPINKPHSLNIGLKHATKDIVVIFDAEDQPSKSIYHIANTQMLKKNFDVLQSGVQLMNFRSSWYATFNVLEYFFWFKSALHYFAKKGVIPLGGNTVFFKRSLLNRLGGWDEQCLTEDAEIGFRMSTVGAKIGVVYDEVHATQEETPHSISSFIKQRTRWNQGFMQVLQKAQWKNLPSVHQRLLAMYILVLPQLQALFFFLVPVSLGLAIFFNLPVIFALMTTVPLLLLLLQLAILSIGLFEFTRGYKKQFPLWMPLKIFFTFYPFQVLLGISAIRAFYRFMFGKVSWEKTLHLNMHRTSTKLPEPTTPDFGFVLH